MIQGSLLALWMDENASQQSNEKLLMMENLQLLGEITTKRLELLLHGEKRQVRSTGEVCWKY